MALSPPIRSGLLLLLAAACACAQDRAQDSYQAELERQWRQHPTLAIGSPAPSFELRGVDGKRHRLEEYAGSPILALVFTCNHCPTAQLYEGRINRLAEVGFHYHPMLSEFSRGLCAEQHRGSYFSRNGMIFYRGE